MRLVERLERTAEERTRLARTRALAVLPAHDERENLEILLPRLLDLDLAVLVVEDASTDGTAEFLDRLGACDARVSAIHRPTLLGLGTAYVEGFSRAIGEGFD